MSDLDALKEQLAYLKLWLGILIVTGISLIGWLLSSFKSTDKLLLISGLVALMSIGLGCYTLHRKIESKISLVKEL